jgi:BlaI family penicillinase repressor
MTTSTRHTTLSKRERQIMDALYRLGRATVSEILEQMHAAPSYSAVRAHLRVLEEKGHVRHEDQGLRYVYLPTVPRHAARKTALKHLLDTFFDGSPASLMTMLLGNDGARLSDEDLDRITRLVKAAKTESR